MLRRQLLVLGFCAAFAFPALAFDLGEEMPDPAAEARARVLFQELRCMVCQNQSIYDSDAPLAKDLRGIVREHLAAGKDEAEIKAFLVARYGDFVLLRPPVEPSTWLLWAAPFLVLAAGGSVALVSLRRRKSAAPIPSALTDEENRRVEALLKQDR